MKDKSHGGDDTPDTLETGREDLLVALQEAERKYRDIFEEGILGISLTTPDGHLLEVNKAFATIMGYGTPQQMIDEVINVGEEVYADRASREQVKEILARDGMVSGFETKFKRKDGSTFWVLINSRVVRDAEGKILYFDSTLEDITVRKLAEEALLESEERFRGLVEQAPDGVALVDRSGRILEWNRALAEMTGMERGEALGRYLWDIQSDLDVEKKRKPEAYRRLREIIESGLESGEASWLNRLREHEICRSDGSRGFLQTITFPIRTSSDTVYASITTDVTSHRVADELSSTIIQSSPAFFVAIDAQDRVIMMNQAMLDALGYEAEEVVGLDYLEGFVPERERAALAAVFQELVKSHRPTLNQNPVLTRDGRELLIEWHGRQVFKPNGDFDYFFGIGIDITERKAAEEELQASEERFRGLVEQSPNGISLVDRSGRILEWNRALAEMTGMERGEALGRYLWDIQSDLDSEKKRKPEAYQRLREIIESGLESGEASWLNRLREYEIRRSDGSRGFLQTITFPIRTSSDTVFAGMAIDVTSRWEANELSSTIIQSSPAFFVAIDAQDKVILMNQAMLDALGYREEEVIGLDYISNFIPERERGALALVFDGLITTHISTPNRNPVLTRDGRELLIEWQNQQIFKPNGDFDYFFGIGIDITERKAAEEEIRRKVLELDALHQASLTFLDQTDLAILPGDICRFTVDHFGLRMAWIGTVQEGDFEVHPTAIHGDERDYLKSVKVTWDDAPTGRGPTGTAIRTGLPQVANRIDSDPAFEAWRAQAEKHGYRSSAALPLRYEHRVIGALNVYSEEPDFFTGERLQVLKAFANSAAVALNRAELFGEVKGHAMELERKVAERTAALEAANKELEAFSYSVSHDLRAPLRSIDGFSKALLEDYYDALDGEARDYLERVRKASQRMAQLIDDMLTLSRLTRAGMNNERVDLSALAGSVAQELKDEQPERQVEFIIAPDAVAWGDARILRQVLENLLGNAWKFTGKHASARIEFGMTESDGQTAYFVRDDGAGFDMTYENKLFGIFQRLHAVNDFPGTGVGLAIVQRVIQRHGGAVWARGEVEKGATFYFTLPAAGP